MFDLASLNIKARTGVYATGKERVVKILETALDILITEGMSAVTLREIARRMGIRVGAIQHYYSSREDLIVDVLEGVLNSYEEFFDGSGAASQASPEERLRAFICAILDDIHTKKTTRLFPELWALANHDANVARMLDAIYIRSRSRVTRLIGEINPALDPRSRESLALFLTASLEGMTPFAGHGKVWGAEMDRIKAIACDSLLAMVRAAQPDPNPDPNWRPPTLLGAEAYRRLTQNGD